MMGRLFRKRGTDGGDVGADVAGVSRLPDVHLKPT
jgi:hypothetical protein